MSNEILAIINHDDKLLLWSPNTLYRAFATGTPTILWQIGRPVYCKPCVDSTNSLMAFGTYTGSTSRVFRVRIASSTTFQYSDDGGATYSAAITITRNAIALSYGINIQFYNTTGFTVADNWAFQVYQAYFPSVTTYMRWAIAKWRNGFFFSNQVNDIKFTEGTIVQNLFSNCDASVKAKYLEVFHEHLVAANVIQDGVLQQERVSWSDIHDMSNFNSAPTNEADFFDLSLDECLKEVSYGVTGLKNLGPHCYVYGPKEIFRLNYVGLPRVIVKELIYSEVGNVFPYALAGNNKFHAFISDENFYLFDGVNAPKSIGDAIKDYYFEDLTTVPEYRYRTFSYINRQYNEIWWIYVSSTSTAAGASPYGLFDKAVVWNFKEDLWYPATVENIHSHMEVSVRNADSYIDSDTRHIDDSSELIDDSGISSTISRTELYGSADRVVLRDEVTADLSASLLAQSVPYLETKDIYYDDILVVKEIDTICIHADYDSTTCDGIEVYYSARDELDNTVSYTLCKQLWTKDLYEGRLSGLRISGRIFRFKFVFKEHTVGAGVRGAIFSAWGENVRGPLPQEEEK